MTRLLIGLPALFLLAIVGLNGGHATMAAPFVFQTDMTGGNVVPAVDTPVYGYVRWFFNEDRSEADYTVDVKSVGNADVLGADIRAGAPGSNGPIVRHLADGGFIVT